MYITMSVYLALSRPLSLSRNCPATWHVLLQCFLKNCICCVIHTVVCWKWLWTWCTSCLSSLSSHLTPASSVLPEECNLLCDSHNFASRHYPATCCLRLPCFLKTSICFCDSRATAIWSYAIFCLNLPMFRINWPTWRKPIFKIFTKYICPIKIYIVLKFQVNILSKTPPIIGKTIKKRPFFGHFFDRCPVFGQ